MGWSLRDYFKTGPGRVRGFPEGHMDKMDKLSVREAGEHL